MVNLRVLQEHRIALANGARDGVPIGLGYFAVAFSLGIAVRNAGMTAVQGFFLSFFGMASAGEYAAITVIAADASYLEMALVTLIANARYLLMSFALSQRMSPETPLRHRLLVGYSITDELFGIAVAQPKPLDPWYCYGPTPSQSRVGQRVRRSASSPGTCSRRASSAR